MIRPRSTEDTLLLFAGFALATLGLCATATWLAAHAAMLVSQHRLLLPESGSILDVAERLFQHPTRPAEAFAPADAAHLPAGYALYAIAAPILGAIIVAIAEALGRASDLLRRDSRDGRWAARSELAALAAPKPHGTGSRLVLGTAGGRLVATEQHHSVVVFGPTGSGKTTSLVIPALLEHSGPIVALSTRSDFLHPTIQARATLGPIFVYDPLAITEYPCVAWTPLRTCGVWAEAQRVADALTSTASDTDDKNHFWNTMACKLLEALLHAAALDNLTMRHVARWVDTREQTQVNEILTRHNATDALQSFTASQSRNDRTLSDIYASAELLLRAYTTPGMADTRPSSSFDPATLLTQNGTLYVCAPTDDQERLRPVFCALVKDVYRAATLHAERQRQALDPSLLLVLDEAANIAPIRDLAEIASTCRGYGIQLVTVFQDLAQVQARYGKKAATVVNNHTAKLLLPGQSDRDLLDLLTRLLGEQTVDHVTHSHSSSGASQSQSTRYRPLAAMHQLRQLPTGHALLLYGNLPPIKIKLRPWYQDPRLTRLAKPPEAA